jgi:3,4-dihydroxy-9,10-secoandrosta-1,3,5(10)-triene-9,17-dione 4,5-dioxygenase
MITALAYIGFTSPDTDGWRTFGPDVLGAELAPDGPDGAVRLRVDDAAARITIHPGDRDDLAYLGWEVDDLEATIAAVQAAGAPVTRGDVATFVDPFGFQHHLVSAVEPGGPFTPGRDMSGFVTGEQGLGHAVLIVPDLALAEAFYTRALGFRVSDTIEAGMTIRFLHCPGHAARHHTLAMVGVPGMAGVHHLMLEVRSLDDVGGALDIVNERQIPLAMSLGRHTNDLMTSFYVRTPSGFEIEYGTGGITVDDDRWQVAVHDATSLWGHKPPASGPLFPSIIRPAESAGAPA